jgi:Homeodomain-like domain
LRALTDERPTNGERSKTHETRLDGRLSAKPRGDEQFAMEQAEPEFADIEAEARYGTGAGTTDCAGARQPRTRRRPCAQKVAWGRPPKLNHARAIEIAALLLAGHSTSDVARMTGVSRRAISGWRRRAWSRDDRDAHCVTLERTLAAGRAALAEAG